MMFITWINDILHDFSMKSEVSREDVRHIRGNFANFAEI